MNRTKKVLITLALIIEIIVFGGLVFLGCTTIGAGKSIIIAAITLIISIISIYYVNKWLRKK